MSLLKDAQAGSLGKSLVLVRAKGCRLKLGSDLSVLGRIFSFEYFPNVIKDIGCIVALGVAPEGTWVIYKFLYNNC